MLAYVVIWLPAFVQPSHDWIGEGLEWVWVKALDKYNVEKDIAAYIKKEFDKKYNPTWHCIVGRNFGETL